MRPVLYTLFLPLLWIAACHQANKPTTKEKLKAKYVFKETIVTGKDTGMNSSSGFRKISIGDILSQRWELADMEDVNSIELVLDKNNKRIIPGLCIFKDSTVVENPRSHFRIGKWKVVMKDRTPMLVLTFNGEQKQYAISFVSSHKLNLATPGINDDSLYIELTSDAITHKNLHNDPFHPINNQWRIRPTKSESDSAIKQRVKQCVKFYALYFRDNIKRNQKEISFLGLPSVFEWYSRAIGMPDRVDIPDSWNECFYNKQEAEKGYDILRNLIIDYEFNWEKNTPNWVYQTESVLEQMYHKL